MHERCGAGDIAAGAKHCRDTKRGRDWDAQRGAECKSGAYRQRRANGQPVVAPTASATAASTASASPSAPAEATPTAITSPPAGSPLEQLMASIPDVMSIDCHEVTSFDGGFIVGVSCVPRPGEGYITYYLFDTVENLNASYEANAAFFGSDADGTSCQVEASEGPYTIDDTPAGSLMCNEYETGLIAYWTHDALLIEASIVLFEGTYDELYSIWQIAGPNPAESPAATPVAAAWSTNAAGFRGQLDQEFVFQCPSGGQAGTVWGTDIYTDDSSVCTAAVHAGLIDLASGGDVTIVMLPGRDSYAPSTRNGITSVSWGSWGSSFSFVTS